MNKKQCTDYDGMGNQGRFPDTRQGRTPKQYSDSAQNAAWGMIMILASLIWVMMTGGETVTNPQLEEFKQEIIQDTVQWESWHGREGQSEYGEYQPND